jgi:hypothetical protein
MNYVGDSLPSVETLKCPKCQQSEVICVTPATPTSRAIFQCLQCKTFIDQDTVQQRTQQTATPDPQTMYAQMLQMAAELTAVRAEISNIQKVVDENATLRNRLLESEKEIEELKKRLTNQQPQQPQTNTRQRQQQPPNTHITGVNTTVPPNHPSRTTNEAPVSQPAPVPQSYAEASSRFRPNQVRSAKRIAASIRAFQEPTGPQGYEYLYLPSRNRSSRQATRQKLRTIGIETNRVLDIYSPARNVVALLLHVQYHAEVTTKLQAMGINPLNFDPLEPIHLKDPQFEGLSTESRALAMEGIHYARMVRTLEHIGAPRYYSVGRSFVEKKWMTETDLLRLTQKDAARAFQPADEYMAENDDIEL